MVGGSLDRRDRPTPRDFKERRCREGAPSRPLAATLADPVAGARPICAAACTTCGRADSGAAAISRGSSPGVCSTGGDACAQASAGTAPHGRGHARRSGVCLLLAHRRAREAKFSLLRCGRAPGKTLLRRPRATGLRKDPGPARRRCVNCRGPGTLGAGASSAGDSRSRTRLTDVCCAALSLGRRSA